MYTTGIPRGIAAWPAPVPADYPCPCCGDGNPPLGTGHGLSRAPSPRNRSRHWHDTYTDCPCQAILLDYNRSPGESCLSATIDHYLAHLLQEAPFSTIILDNLDKISPGHPLPCDHPIARGHQLPTLSAVNGRRVTTGTPRVNGFGHLGPYPVPRRPVPASRHGSPGPWCTLII